MSEKLLNIKDMVLHETLLSFRAPYNGVYIYLVYVKNDLKI